MTNNKDTTIRLYGAYKQDAKDTKVSDTGGAPVNTYNRLLDISKTSPEFFQELVDDVGLLEEDVSAMFDAVLDEEGDVIVAGISFSRSAILKEMDPIAYRTYLADYLDTAEIIEVNGVFFGEDEVADILDNDGEA